jgi:hypothetical protein
MQHWHIYRVSKENTAIRSAYLKTIMAKNKLLLTIPCLCHTEMERSSL